MFLTLQLRLWLFHNLKSNHITDIHCKVSFVCKSNWREKRQRQFSLAILVQSTCICWFFCRDTVKFHNSFCCWRFSNSCCRDLTKNTLWKVYLFKFARSLSLKGIIVAPFSAWKLCLVTLRVFHLKRSQFLIFGVRSQRKGPNK